MNTVQQLFGGWVIILEFGSLSSKLNYRVPKLNLPKLNFQFYNHIMNNMEIAKIEIEKK